MARGWESKSVESQQEALAERAARRASGTEPAIDPAAASARQTLHLSLARAEAELARVVNLTHRKMLQRVIADLTRQLEER